MEDWKRIHALQDTVGRQTQEIMRLQQALRDIAGSEMIPTPEKAYMFCVEVARSALRDDPEGEISCQS